MPPQSTLSDLWQGVPAVPMVVRAGRMMCGAVSTDEPAGLLQLLAAQPR